MKPSATGRCAPCGPPLSPVVRPAPPVHSFALPPFSQTPAAAHRWSPKNAPEKSPLAGSETAPPALRSRPSLFPRRGASQAKVEGECGEVPMSMVENKCDLMDRAAIAPSMAEELVRAPALIPFIWCDHCPGVECVRSCDAI